MLGPIFVRELTTVPRAKSHYAARAALIGLLTVLGVTIWQASVGFDRDRSLLAQRRNACQPVAGSDGARDPKIIARHDTLNFADQMRLRLIDDQHVET